MRNLILLLIAVTLVLGCNKSNTTFSINQGYDTLNIKTAREYIYNSENDTITFHADGWVSERAGKAIRTYKISIQPEKNVMSPTGIYYVVRFAQDTQKFTGADYGNIKFLGRLPAFFTPPISKSDTIYFAAPNFKLSLLP